MRKLAFLGLAISTVIAAQFLVALPSLAVDPLQTSPSTWLPQVGAGSGLPVSPTGQNFIIDKIIPFAISGSIFLAFVLSLIFTIIGGIKLMMSGGTKDGAVKAKQMITYALIGLALTLSVFLVFGIIQALFRTKVFGLPAPNCAPWSYVGPYNTVALYIPCYF